VNGAGAESEPLTPTPTPKIIVESMPLPSTFWERLKRQILFWQPSADRVACTILTPNRVLPGESLGLQVVIHSSGRKAQANALPDWGGSKVIANPLERGATADLHLDMPGLTLAKPLQQVKWTGVSSATIFNLRIPDSWHSGIPVQGTLSIYVDQKLVVRMEFHLPVGLPHNSVRL
jgi:hypothetical protein